MRKFSSIRESEATMALQKEITQFINKVNKKIPEKVKQAILLSQRLGIEDGNDIKELAAARKTEIKKLAIKWDMNEEDLGILRELLIAMRTSINLMPQLMTKTQREMLEKGKMSVDDMTMDFESRAGRNAIARLYMPLVISMASKFVGKSPKVTKEDLIGVGTETLMDCMGSYKDEVLAKGLTMTFGAYLKKQIYWKMGDFIIQYGNDFSGTNDYAYKQSLHSYEDEYGETKSSSDLIAKSIDNFRSSDSNDVMYDKIAALGVTDNRGGKSEMEGELNKLFGAIDKNFSKREADIFYRSFGVNGREKEKGGDIASFYGISGGTVTNVIKKVIKFIKTDKSVYNTLDTLRDMFMESLLYELRNYNAKMIKESLIMDDIYAIFEDVYKWDNKKTFVRQFEKAIKVADITDILTDFNTIDQNYKLRKRDIDAFLVAMYPYENISMKNDVDKLEMLQDVLDHFNKHINESKESIESVDDLKDAMRSKFKEVFGDKLDKERMEFTIKGFIKSNKKDVENKDWGQLIGKFNQSFVHESMDTSDPVCRLYNIFWGTPTDSVMYMVNGVRYVSKADVFEKYLYKTNIAAYSVSQSGFINLAAMLESFNLGWIRIGDKIMVGDNKGVKMGDVKTFMLGSERRDIKELGILPMGSESTLSYSKKLKENGIQAHVVEDYIWAKVGDKMLVIEANERQNLPELEKALEKIGPLYIVKSRRGYRISSDDKKWNRVLKTPMNYLPLDFMEADVDTQFNDVMDVIKTIS